MSASDAETGPKDVETARAPVERSSASLFPSLTWLVGERQAATPIPPGIIAAAGGGAPNDGGGGGRRAVAASERKTLEPSDARASSSDAGGDEDGEASASATPAVAAEATAAEIADMAAEDGGFTPPSSPGASPAKKRARSEGKDGRGDGPDPTAQLRAWLAARGLAPFADALVALGARRVADLAYLDDGDFADLGMAPDQVATCRVRVAR